MRIAAIIIVFLFTTMSYADEITEAKKWVENLYSNYQKDFEAKSIIGPNADSIYGPELLNLALLDSKLANGENGFLDWDPLCDCQDPERMRIDQISVKKLNENVCAELKFTISETMVAITLKLQKFKGKWLICDVGSTTTPSLFEYLKKGIASLQVDSKKPN